MYTILGFVALRKKAFPMRNEHDKTNPEEWCWVRGSKFEVRGSGF
jgi:hypothetical protein